MTLDLEILCFKNIKHCQETRHGFGQVLELGAVSIFVIEWSLQEDLIRGRI